MEYFDFENATSSQPLRQGEANADDCASDQQDFGTDELEQSYDCLFNDQQFTIPTAEAEPVFESLPDDWHLPTDLPQGVEPIYRPERPCVYCSGMGLECFLAQRGTLQNGCLACTSLWRECSFVKNTTTAHAHIDTLAQVSEDVVSTGGLTGKLSFKSVAGKRLVRDVDSAKKGARFPRNAVRILKEWVATHANHPYPSEEEKDELKERTGLKTSQIANWLANARRRGKTRSASSSNESLAGDPAPGGIAIPRVTDQEWKEMPPMERWKHSPPEHEPASFNDIFQAVGTAPYHSVNNSSHSSLANSRIDSSNGRSMHGGPSLDSSETWLSSTSDISFASAYSHRSRSSFESKGFKDHRRRRRAKKAPQKEKTGNTKSESRGARLYQCTFCPDTFNTKYDWQRHEKSLHLALERWTCTPLGGLPSPNGTPICVFCNVENPDRAHLDLHNFTECQDKPLEERTFFRKDHLRQHLRLVHGVKHYADPSMEGWKSIINDVKSECGFCPTTMTTWTERVDHLANHFKAGVDMSLWACPSGDWGFESHVTRLLENAMPPYLITQERNSMDPFSTEAQQGQALSGCGRKLRSNNPDVVTCWENLRTELKLYVESLGAKGVLPSDTMLQAEARMIIYASDDTWNQTAADNVQWLETFKAQVGLSDGGVKVGLDRDTPPSNASKLGQIEPSLACSLSQEISPTAPWTGQSAHSGQAKSGIAAALRKAKRAELQQQHSPFTSTFPATKPSPNSSFPVSPSISLPQQGYPQLSTPADSELNFSNLDLDLGFDLDRSDVFASKDANAFCQPAAKGVVKSGTAPDEQVEMTDEDIFAMGDIDLSGGGATF